MRRPWVVMLTSFALVMGLGGLAFAAGGVPFIDDGNDSAIADSREADLPDFDPSVPDRVEGSEKDEPKEPVKDEPVKQEVKDEEVKDEPAKDEAKDEPVEEEKDEVKEEPKAEPPKLAILYPEDGAKVDDEKMVFEGEATPGARVFAGKWEADVSDDGAWRIVLILEPGTQKVKFRAESAGGVAEAAVSVTRVVPDKPKEEPSEYELVAHQVYGECDAEVPYDVFWGETAPNAHVLVWSEYGSGETYANGEGEFELQVEFPNAPYGQAFQVKVKSIDQKRYFEFIGYGHSYELIAHQVHGASEAELPFDVFYGETKPGAYVLVWSEYGQAEGYANGEGQFEIRVDFPEAPYGVEFQVKVKSIEQKRYFSFTSWGNPPAGEGGGEGA